LSLAEGTYFKIAKTVIAKFRIKVDQPPSSPSGSICVFGLPTSPVQSKDNYVTDLATNIDGLKYLHTSFGEKRYYELRKIDGTNYYHPSIKSGDIIIGTIIYESAN